jgi:hypothetical protein
LRSTSRQRRAPWLLGGHLGRSVRWQDAPSFTTIAPLPARSWSRVIIDRPSLTATWATLQPTGRNCTHGTSDAEGADWGHQPQWLPIAAAHVLDPQRGLHGVLAVEQVLGFRAAWPPDRGSPPTARSGGRSTAGPGCAAGWPAQAPPRCREPRRCRPRSRCIEGRLKARLHRHGQPFAARPRPTGCLAQATTEAGSGGPCPGLRNKDIAASSSVTTTTSSPRWCGGGRRPARPVQAVHDTSGS